MKSFTAGSLLIAKLLTLLCFTNMGILTMDISAEAMAPCHETTHEHSSSTDCNACLTALDSWSQNYISAAEIEIPTVIAMAFVPSILENSITKSARDFTQVYRPPPVVTWLNAFHQPQLSTVIIV